MVKQNKPSPKVRVERLPNRRAVERMREAYQRLMRSASEKLNQEAEHEHISGAVRPGVNLATRAGSDH